MYYSSLLRCLFLCNKIKSVKSFCYNACSDWLSALTWDKKLPNNVQSVLLDKAIAMEGKPTTEKPEVKIPTSGLFSKINLISPVAPRAKGKIRLNDSYTVV